MPSRSRVNGFTLVELMLAMAFVSMLLLAIAMTVMNIMHIYTKGLTMKAVNQAGREVVTDMKRTVGEGQVFTIASGADPVNSDYGRQSPFILQDASGNFVSKGTDNSDSHGGRFCTGNYSYVWNTGRYVPAQVNHYADATKQLRLVRVEDGGGTYCSNPKKDIPDGATELLSEADLAVQNFHIEQLSSGLASGQALYRFTIRLSSANPDAVIKAEDGGALTTLGECQPPSADIGLEDFCSVNDFVFTVNVSSIGS